MKNLKFVLVLSALLLSLACSDRSNAAYKDSVESALKQADLTGLSVSEDKDKNTITLSGTLHSDDAKAKASDVAKAAAPNRIVANEISVQPVGAESEAKEVASNLDDAIEKNYKAALISHRLDKQSIHFNAKNGVLTLTGSVKTEDARQIAESTANAIPNVHQVVNQLDVKR